MNAREFAPIVLRVGLAIVVLWFGVSQLISPAEWTGFLPSWLPSFGMSPETHVILNGSAEVILGLFVLLGLFTRVAAGLAALHMYIVTIVVGYTAVGVRDFGLFVALVAVALQGSDDFSIDRVRAKKN